MTVGTGGGSPSAEAGGLSTTLQCVGVSSESPGSGTSAVSF